MYDPRLFYLYSYMIPFLGISVYLYFTPNTLIASLSSFLNFSLPNPLGNYWAAVYASVPALFSFLGSYFAARGVKGDVQS